MTVTDALLAFPIAFYMAKLASPRVKGALIVAVLMPLWSFYLVKVYAWQTMLGANGIINWALDPLGPQRPGFRRHRGLDRGELPLAAVHDPADLRRARAHPRLAALRLRGPRRASRCTTFRRVILPLAFPAVVAGSIFTFSLTLGDYITPSLVSPDTQFIGNVVFTSTPTTCPWPRPSRRCRSS